MDDKGWIKLHRVMLKNPIVMKDADHLAVWVWLLLNASRQDYDTLFGGQRITLKAGQLITGRQKIASELNIEQSKVKRIIKLFKNEQQIDQLSKPYGSLITILSWNEYQQNDQQTDQRVTNERPTDDQRVTTIQEYKEYKKNKKIEKYRGMPDDFVDALKGFKEMRSKMKAPLTDRAETMIINKALKLSDGDYCLATDIVNQSIERGWKSLYELKDDRPKGQSGLPYTDIDF